MSVMMGITVQRHCTKGVTASGRSHKRLVGRHCNTQNTVLHSSHQLPPQHTVANSYARSVGNVVPHSQGRRSVCWSAPRKALRGGMFCQREQLSRLRSSPMQTRSMGLPKHVGTASAPLAASSAYLPRDGTAGKATYAATPPSAGDGE